MNRASASLVSVTFITLAASLLGAVGCSSTTTSDGSSGTPGPAAPSGNSGTARTGITPCGSFPDGAKTCQAGQYCDDERISQCTTGCLTDNNCPSTDTCEKSASASVGACAKGAVTPPTTTTSCTDMCKKAVACGIPQSQTQCEDACIGLPEACKACVIKQPCNAQETACNTECGT